MPHKVKIHQDRIERAIVEIPGEEILTAWQQGNDRFEQDTLAFWQAQDLLPSSATPEDRLKELAAIAYIDNEFAGVATSRIGAYDALKANFAFIRIAVVPAFRLNYLQIRLSAHAHQLMENFALEHPELELSGVAVVRQADFQETRKTPPVSLSNKTVMVNYNDKGHQVRVRWFPHVRV